MIAESEVKRWGNSLGLILPKRFVEQVGLKEGEEVSVDIVKRTKPNAFGICKGAKPFHRDEDILDR